MSYDWDDKWETTIKATIEKIDGAIETFEVMVNDAEYQKLLDRYFNDRSVKSICFKDNGGFLKFGEIQKKGNKPEFRKGSKNGIHKSIFGKIKDVKCVRELD